MKHIIYTKRNKWTHRVLCLLVFIMASVIGCSQIRVNTDYDPTVAFSDLNTYKWIPDLQKNLPVENSILDSRIRFAVDNQLAAKGYKKVSTETANFRVAYYLTTQERHTVTTSYYDYGYASGRHWRRGGMYGGSVRAETHVDTYEEGTLILDFVDPVTKKLIWRGTAQAEIDRYASAQAKQERLNEAVGLMLEQFPPPP